MRISWKGRAFEDRPWIKDSRAGSPSVVSPVGPTERAQYLIHAYQLEHGFDRISLSTCLESLGSLDLLDRLPSSVFSQLSTSTLLQVLDVGAKNWRYLPALVTWLETRFPQRSLEITGVELDAYRLYRDLRTRYSYGEYFARAFSGHSVHCKYQAGDIRSFKEKADLVTWFFPFVLPETHRAWGLSLKSFDPEGTFAHVVSLLSSSGTLVMANQGEWEWRTAERLLQNQRERLRLVHTEIVEGSLHESLYPIFLSVWTREQ